MADEENILPPEAGDAPDSAPVADAPHDAPADNGPDAREEVSAESLAAELGWAPKDSWRGNEEDWKDAKSFLKDTVEINKTTRRELKATREAAERAARAAASITERAVEEERSKLLQARREAFEAGDGQTFTAAEQRLATLPQPTVPIQSAESQEFMKRNASWFGVDPIATQIAYNVCEMHKGKDYATQLEEAEKVIRQRFPEYASKQSGKGPAQVETGASRATATARKGPKGFNDLPPEFKRAALDYDKRGRATKEEYAKIYWEDNA